MPAWRTKSNSSSCSLRRNLASFLVASAMLSIYRRASVSLRILDQRPILLSLSQPKERPIIRGASCRSIFGNINLHVSIAYWPDYELRLIRWYYESQVPF